MSGRSRKLHYKYIKAAAGVHVGYPGDVWYDDQTTALRFYNGDPGGEALSSGGLTAGNFKDYGSYEGTNSNAPIDLTKKYHWIVNLDDGYHYTLADGVQGQEITFFPCLGLTPQNDDSDLWVDNAKYWNDGAGQWDAGARVLRLFTNANAENVTSAITAIFINGCWNFTAGAEDQGGFGG